MLHLAGKASIRRRPVNSALGPTIQLLKHSALLLIRAYQRFLSPYKGFSCAYRVHTGRASCSTFGFRVVRRFGVTGGCTLLRARLSLCSDCFEERETLSKRRLSQLGSCAAPCDIPCDGNNLECAGEACRCADCSSCDWPRSKKDKYPTRAQREEARRRTRAQSQSGQSGA